MIPFLNGRLRTRPPKWSSAYEVCASKTVILTKCEQRKKYTEEETYHLEN